ncbi:MAG: ATP-binding protein [Spirochaetia bacterium]
MRRTLLKQIFPVYLFIVLFSLVVFFLIGMQTLQPFFYSQSKWNLEESARILRNLLPNTYADLLANAEEFCDQAARGGLTRITIILTNGTVIGDSELNPDQLGDHSNRREILQALHNEYGISTRYSISISAEMMYYALPVRYSGNVVAVLRTSLPLASIEQTINTVNFQIIIAGVFIIILTSLASLYIVQRIRVPLQELQKAAIRYADGDLDYHAPVTKPAEMQKLADFFYSMAHQLKDRIETIEKQRREIESVLSGMVEGVIVLDNRKQVIQINPAACALFNISQEEALQKNILDVARNIAIHEFIEETFRSETTTEQTIRLYLERALHLQVHGSVLRNTDKSQQGAVFVFNDITRLIHLEQIRKDFVGNVSHELKTPVTSIKGFVETLLDTPIENAQIKRFLEIIQKQTNRLTFIIEDLLSLSRLEEANEREMQLEEYNARELVENALQICSSRKEAQNISLYVNIEEDLKVMINPLLFEQALANILDNAMKYSDPGEEVTIKAYSDAEAVVFSIADNGYGIPPKASERIFERFYRVDKSRSRNLGGTGLGLAIVKHVVKLHSGTVSVESAEGAGSTFTIRIPKTPAS